MMHFSASHVIIMVMVISYQLLVQFQFMYINARRQIILIFFSLSNSMEKILERYESYSYAEGKLVTTDSEIQVICQYL